MSTESVPTAVQKPIRLWPAWLILGLQAGLMVFTVTAEFDNFIRFVAMMAGPLLCGLSFLVYLLFFSRLKFWESGTVLVQAVAGALLLGLVLGHASIGSALWIYGIPLAMLVVTLGLTWSRNSLPGSRTTWAGLLAFACWGVFMPARLDGFDGTYYPEFASRWSPEVGANRLKVEPDSKDSSLPSEPIVLSEGDWPTFRGPAGDSRVIHSRISDDWEKKSPKTEWKVKVGPAWSSMAIAGDSLFTQEQIGQKEAVVSYDRSTGKERWRHEFESRFEEIVSGPGPRGTPTFHDGLVYAVGGQGYFQALNARTGELQWEHVLKSEYNADLNMWGYACSPLVTAGQVIVYTRGANAKGWIAFDAKTGKESWFVPSSGENYTSAQLITLGETSMVALITEKGVVGADPASGKVIWEHTPEGWSMAPMVQPQLVDAASLVVSIGDGKGSARFTLTPSTDAWKIKNDWLSRNLKPSFNDFVYHDGSLFGFDQNIFACVDAASGAKQWKKGRYGFGQCLLFADQGLVLVLTEFGELVLLAADKSAHRELGRYNAIEGKTWNHPAFAHGKLFVRNGQEMACVDLSP